MDSITGVLRKEASINEELLWALQATATFWWRALYVDTVEHTTFDIQVFSPSR